MSKNSPDRRVSKELQEIARKIHVLLEEAAGQPMGFSLLVFQAEPDSRMNYCSNCDRQEVIVVMEFLLESWRNGMPDIKGHEVE